MNETIRRQALDLCSVLYDKKAQNILAIHVADKTVIADYFVIASGRAAAQNKALCDELEKKAPGFGLTLHRRDGYSEGRWIVLDYGDILVHLFHPDERRYYNIERLWDEDNQAMDYSKMRDEEEEK